MLYLLLPLPLALAQDLLADDEEPAVQIDLSEPESPLPPEVRQQLEAEAVYRAGSLHVFTGFRFGGHNQALAEKAGLTPAEARAYDARTAPPDAFQEGR